MNEDPPSSDLDPPTEHRYHMEDGEAWSVATVRAVAEATGRDPLSLPEALYDVTDPDALDVLFVSSGTAHNGRGCLSFEYCGCRVVVSSDRTIAVERRSSE